jgi:hypothetical protein
MTFPESLADEIASRLARGFDDRAGVLTWVVEMCELTELGLADDEHVSDVDELDPGVRAKLAAAIDEAFRRKETEIASWPSTTDCDRLTAAFATLSREGIVAIDEPHHDFALAIERAANTGQARVAEGGAKARGYAFYSDHDVWLAMQGDGLVVAFGSFEEDEPPPKQPKPALCPGCQGRGWLAPKSAGEFPSMCSCKKDPAPPIAKPLTRAQTIGEAVVAACRTSGLAVEWDRSDSGFVKLPSFRWQRRGPRSS